MDCQFIDQDFWDDLLVPGKPSRQFFVAGQPRLARPDFRGQPVPLVETRRNMEVNGRAIVTSQ